MKQKVMFDWKAPVFGLLCAILLNIVWLWSRAIFPGLIQNYQAPEWAMVLSQVVSQWSRGMWLAFFPAVVALWMLYSRREGRGILIYLEGILFLLLFAVLLERIISGLTGMAGLYFHLGFFYFEMAFISLCPVLGAVLLLLPHKTMENGGKGILWILGGAGGLLWAVAPDRRFFAGRNPGFPGGELLVLRPGSAFDAGHALFHGVLPPSAVGTGVCFPGMAPDCLSFFPHGRGRGQSAARQSALAAWYAAFRSGRLALAAEKKDLGCRRLSSGPAGFFCDAIVCGADVQGDYAGFSPQRRLSLVSGTV